MGALEIAKFKELRCHPFAPSYAMGTGHPIIVNQPMATGAQLLHIAGHDSRSVVGGIFITVLDEVAVIASVVGPVVQCNRNMGN